MAQGLPSRVPDVPLDLYLDRLGLTLESASGERYDVSLPYCDGCGPRGLRRPDYSGFVKVMERGQLQCPTQSQPANNPTSLVGLRIRTDPRYRRPDGVRGAGAATRLRPDHRRYL